MIAWIVAHRDIVAPATTLVLGLIAGRLLLRRSRPAKPTPRPRARRHHEPLRAEQIIGHRPTAQSVWPPNRVADPERTLYMSTHDIRRALTADETQEWPVVNRGGRS